MDEEDIFRMLMVRIEVFAVTVDRQKRKIEELNMNIFEMNKELKERRAEQQAQHAKKESE